jgi:hypothetical protein
MTTSLTLNSTDAGEADTDRLFEYTGRVFAHKETGRSGSSSIAGDLLELPGEVM